MVIHSSEAEVIERRRAKRIKHSRCGCANLDRTGRDRFEQLLEFGFGHGVCERKNAGTPAVSLNSAERANILRVLMPRRHCAVE
jgi:hypothetical protein